MKKLRIDETPEWKIILFLFLVTLIFRMLTLEVIEDSGDGVFYWQAAQKIKNGIPYGQLTHWNTRFGIIIPQLAVLHIFGSHPRMYYFLPFTFSCVQIILLYYIGSRLFTRKTAVTASLMLLLYPEMARASSQLLPGIFSGTYILITLTLLYLFSSSKKNYIYIVLAAFTMFLAYETKVTNLFFLPGILLALLLITEDIKPPLIYGMVLFGLFLGECFIYQHITGDFLARAHAITGRHLEGGGLESVNFFFLFVRWILPGPLFILFFAASIYGSYLLLKKSLKQKAVIIILPMLSFIFFLTFTVKSIFPLVPATNFRIRYWNTALPLIICTASYCMYYLKQKKNIQVNPRIIQAVLIIVISIYMFFFRYNFTHHSLFRVSRVYTAVNNAIRNNTPLLFDQNSAEMLYTIKQANALSSQGKKEEEILKQLNITEKEYESRKDIRTRLDKSERLIKNIFIDLRSLPPSLRTTYPKLISHNLYTKETGEKTYFLTVKNSDHGEIVKKLENRKSDVYVLERRPVDIYKTTVFEYWNDTE